MSLKGVVEARGDAKIGRRGFWVLGPEVWPGSLRLERDAEACRLLAHSYPVLCYTWDKDGKPRDPTKKSSSRHEEYQT